VKLACAAAVVVTVTGVLPSATHALPKLAARASRSFYADGTILAVAATPDRVYVGGDFKLIGPPTGSWVAVRADGAPVQGRPAVEGTVSAAVADGRGGWFVAGAITGVGAAEHAATVAHLRVNSQLDRSWQVAVGGGRVDPHFARAGKQRPSRPGTIQTLALSRDGRTLYVAGSFDRIGGQRRRGLAAVTVSRGGVSRWNPAPNGSVNTIEPATAGRGVFLGGDFTRIGGAARNAIAAVNVGNGRSLAFNAHASQYAGISDLAVTSSVVYVAGSFTTLGGKSRHLLAGLNPRTGAVTGWEPNVSGDDVTALAVDPRQNAVYIAGNLNEVGGQQRDTLAAVDAHTGGVTPWDPRALGRISILVRTAGGLVFAGGDIAFVGGSRRHGLASFGRDGSLSDWNPPWRASCVRSRFARTTPGSTSAVPSLQETRRRRGISRLSTSRRARCTRSVGERTRASGHSLHRQMVQRCTSEVRS